MTGQTTQMFKDYLVICDWDEDPPHAFMVVIGAEGRPECRDLDFVFDDDGNPHEVAIDDSGPYVSEEGYLEWCAKKGIDP